MIQRPDVERATAYAQACLEYHLSPVLTYHSLEHTCDEVVSAVEHLAQLEGVEGEDMLLLRTAAFYHDIGFIRQHHDHEAAGVQIVRTTLPYFGYSPGQIDVIAAMILATRLPQSPRTLLEYILVDADLDSLGRRCFLPRSIALRTELAAFGSEVGLADWYQRQLQFLSQHRYFCAAACKLLNRGKQRNIALLQSLLAAR
jgi:uncharacterized protein